MFSSLHALSNNYEKNVKLLKRILEKFYSVFFSNFTYRVFS